MATLHVATRKGLLTFEERSGAWRLADTAFLGDPVSSVLVDARDRTLYAALNLGHFGVKLHRSDDRGKSWTELAPPAFAESNGSEDDAPSVSLIWTLEPGGADRPGVLWAGTIPGGLFRSDNRGESWTLNEALWNDETRPNWFGGGYDKPGIHSICVDPRDSRRLTIGISTAGVWLSDDGGAHWRLGGKGLRAAYMPPDKAFEPLTQDPHRLAQCAAAPDTIWCQHHNGIFLTRDRGATFTEIESPAPSRFGFGVVVHPADPETAWFVPAVKDECRVPVDQRLVVTRTLDGGKSFAVLNGGLPPPPAFDLIYRHGLDIDATGRGLAMGSTTGSLWASADGGAAWTPLATHLPPIAQVRWAPDGWA